MGDPYDLERFVTAQDRIYPTILGELAAGAKRSHWMWFVFPQIAGLGHSAMSQHFALNSWAEAQAYLAHPVTGDRLLACTRLVNQVQGRSAQMIFGSPDDLKFRSSMTLFSRAASAEPVFAEALRRYFAGEPDPLTLDLLSRQGG